MRPNLPPFAFLLRRRWTLTSALSGLVLSSACALSSSDNQCSADADCISLGAEARCEVNQFCTYADATCVNGRRWQADADGALANACFDPADIVEPGTDTAATGTSTSTSTTLGTSTADPSTSTTADPITTTGEEDTTEGPATDGATEASGTDTGAGAADEGSSGSSDAVETSSSSGEEPSEPTLCDEVFGEFAGYESCEAEETRCTFSMILEDSDFRNCNGACNSVGDGWSCEASINNPEGGGCEPSEGDEEAECGTEAIDQICVCAHD